MTPASGASMTRHCISRTGTPSKSGPSASGDTSSTAGQPRDQELWARKAGWRATSDSPHILSARWHSFHGNLLRYQRQLEGALEIHTLSCELDAVTEQVREKVSGQQMWPGGDSCPQVLPCARLSSPAGALRWSPGTLSPGSALQKPRCRPGGQPPGPFCPLKPCECRGQTPGPGLPQLSLSESGPVGHRHQDCVSHGRATRAEHWQRWRRSCCGQPKKPRVRETVLSSLAPAPARAWLSVLRSPRGMGVTRHRARGSPSWLAATASREPHPTYLLGTFPSTKGRGPHQPLGGPWQGVTLGTCFLHRMLRSAAPLQRGGCRTKAKPVPPVPPRWPGSGPWTAGRTWRVCRGCCGGRRRWSRKWASSRPGWRCAAGCGGGPRAPPLWDPGRHAEGKGPSGPREQPGPLSCRCRRGLPSPAQLLTLLPPQSLDSKVGHLCQRSPQAAHSLSCKQRGMVDSWAQLRSRVQRRYEPSLPLRTTPSVPTLPLGPSFP